MVIIQNKFHNNIFITFILTTGLQTYRKTFRGENIISFNFVYRGGKNCTNSSFQSEIYVGDNTVKI